MTPEQIRTKIADHKKAESQMLHRIGEIRGALATYREWLSDLEQPRLDLEEPKE